MRQGTGIAVVLLAASLAGGADSAGKKKSEAEWAKDVAVDFLKTVRAKEVKQALQLLTSKLAARLEKDAKQYILPPHPLDNAGVESWEFNTEKMAPDKDEMAFSGKVFGKDGQDFESQFTIRVVKDKEVGRWRRCFGLIDRGTLDFEASAGRTDVRCKG